MAAFDWSVLTDLLKSAIAQDVLPWLEKLARAIFGG
ncbi:Uncharacterised protein [Mycobacteroides abscessus subsp. abscessus]|nr:Uncharacterised protein [Mycobacteroides abscessus subsp. abscessus]